MRRRHLTFQFSPFSFHLKQIIQSYTTPDVLFWDVPQIAAYHKKLLARIALCITMANNVIHFQFT